LPPISPELALTGISVALAGDLPQVVVSAEIDWERLVRYEPTVAQTDRLLELCGPYLNQNDAESVAALKRQLQSQQPAERIETLGAVLRDIIASELRLASEMLAAGRPLDEVGVDSLMALNIQTAIERATGVTLSTLSLTGEATIESIAERMLSELGMAGDGVEGEPDGETTATQQQVAAQ
jgi:acyl carrier protein